MSDRGSGSHDVTVVGGGVIGASIAYHLAKAGLRVGLFERLAIGAEASGASAGGVRQQHRHAFEMPLALASIRRWKTLEEELGADLAYRRQGGLRLAQDDEQGRLLQTAVRQENAWGLTDLVWLDADACAEAVPGLGPGFVGGSYCPSDGHADPLATTRSFARRAAAFGADVRVGEVVTGIVRSGANVTGLRLGSGEAVAAEWVVNAAGAWGAALSATVGVDVPVRARVPQMLATMPAPGTTLGPVVSLADRTANRTLSLKQTPGGAFMLGGGWPSDVGDGGRPRVSTSAVEGARAMARRVLPAIAALPTERIWFGTEAQSHDGLPVLGAVPWLDGYALAIGFSGHGFAIAPAVGEAIADVVRGAAPRLPIAPFSIERFAPGAPAPGAVDDISAG